MPDLRAHASDCRFYNCTHRHEPGCGVLAALERGEIAESRYRIYREIFDELRPRALSSRAQPIRLASDSSASSSIHSTTERQTRPTTLRRWPSCGGTPGVEPSAAAEPGGAPASKVLERSGVTPGAAAAAELHADRAGGRGEDDAFVGVLPQRRRRGASS